MPKDRVQTALCFADPSMCEEVSKIRLGIFDDHDLMREALARALRAEPAFEIVASGSSAEMAISAAGEFLPDIMLLDVSMPGGGIYTAQEVFKANPYVKCVMLSSNDDEDIVSAALSAGAYAFLAKGIPSRELASSLKRIYNGWSIISPGLASQLISSRGFGAPWSTAPESASIELCEREEQILRRLSQGLTEQEVAEGIGLPVVAVGGFVTNLLLKLHQQTSVDQMLAARS